MPAPSTNDELVGLIRKSGMLDESRLDAYLQHLSAYQGVPDGPKQLVGAMVRDGLLTYFQADQFMLGKWRGFTLGRYKLLERVGVGGYGQVFLCEHLYMKRRVAIKILPPAKAEEPAALGRFYREARAAGILDHPNIVRTHDIDQDAQFHFLVMEYVDGSSLLELVKKFGRMDPIRAAHYVRAGAAALDHAHRAGLVHRDIKPGNLMVDREGTLKLLDLGLARFYHDHQDVLTLKYDENSVLGTADYVAPEQTLNSHTVDIRADVYGLGCTFYFLLAGHPPFPEGTVSQKLQAHQNRMPTPIRTLRPEIPEGLAAILNKMMVKDPRHRYQSPEEVVAALAPWTSSVIDPPAAYEMPQLSPAAMASGGGGMDSRASVSGASRASMSQYDMPPSGGSGRAALVAPGRPPGGSGSGSAVRPDARPAVAETRPMNSATGANPPTARPASVPNINVLTHPFGVDAPPAPSGPTYGRLALLVLMAAFIGSGLAAILWWKFKG